MSPQRMGNRLDGRVNLQVGHLVIVEPGASNTSVIEREAERLDEVKLPPRRQARTPGTAGIADRAISAPRY